jgi:hypothetical protein
MKKIPLTQGFTALVSDRDYRHVSTLSWHAHILYRIDGAVKTVYAENSYRKTNGRKSTRLMHREILEVDEKVKVDHRDHNGLNNQRGNLRSASVAQNTQYQRLSSANTSGFKGVGWSKRYKNWEAGIQRKGKHFFLGSFKDKVEAAKAYDRAARRLFGRFALTNF